MRVSVSLLPPDNLTDGPDVAVVIDVLRATSVIAAALSAGATQIITRREVADAFTLKESITPEPLLCGERGCKPIVGFDHGNSPAEYTPAAVAGRTLILTTTNGTAAVESTAPVGRVITASFLNFSAVLASIGEARNVHLVCAGTNGSVTAEDSLLAGGLVHHCERLHSASAANDESVLARQLWISWFGSRALPSPAALANRLRETQGGRNLVRVGYRKDIERCADLDSLDVVPERIANHPATFGA